MRWMKELYDDPKMEVIIFEVEDIITTSDYGGAGVGGAIDGAGTID